MNHVTTPHRLRNLFLLSVPLFIVHSIEEYFTEFYNSYPLFPAAGQYFASSAQTSFVVFSLVWWLLLLCASILMLTGNYSSKLMFIPGLIYLYEFHHIIKAMLAVSYYPGLITALYFPIIAFFFWREPLIHSCELSEAGDPRSD